MFCRHLNDWKVRVDHEIRHLHNWQVRVDIELRHLKDCGGRLDSLVERVDALSILVERVDALSFQVYQLELSKARMTAAFIGIADAHHAERLEPPYLALTEGLPLLPKCPSLQLPQTWRQWPERIPCGAVLVPGDYFQSENCTTHVVLREDCIWVAYNTSTNRVLWAIHPGAHTGNCKIALNCSLIFTSNKNRDNAKVHYKHYVKFYDGDANVPPVVVAQRQYDRYVSPTSVISPFTPSGSDLSDLARFSIDEDSGTLFAGIPGESMALNPVSRRD